MLPNLETILVLGTLITGVVWAIDLLMLRKARAEKKGKEPWFVEYSRSFFPVLFVVLVLRSFVAEPFRIPSESMVPTLLKGDFILVNKFAYGIRLPITKAKVIPLGEPKRGDVVVFRYPVDPKVDFIKRIVGLPGDHIEYVGRELYVNGVRQPHQATGRFRGDGTILHERLDGVLHDILLMPVAINDNREYRVPPGHYFAMGDNRDNSSDSRVWGFVPEENLVGKAFVIWMNADWQGGGFDLRRIGKTIQ